MGILGKLLGNDGSATAPTSEPIAVASWPQGRGGRVNEVAKAAGVGVARVRCHHTTWDYLQEQAHEEHGRRGSFRPGAFRPSTDGDEVTTGADGIVTVPLGGSSLAAVLDWCYEVQGILSTDLDRAIGRRVGQAISNALQNLTPSDAQGDSSAVIWLDDRIAVESPAPIP